MPYDITSPANERIKRLIRLRDRRHRDAEGVFVVEGPRLVGRAIETGLEPLEIYVDDSTPDLAISHALAVEPTVLSRASYRKQSEGVIAVFEQLPLRLDQIDTNETPLILAAESIEKPGNLGAMLRTADASGANGFVAVGESTDVFNPNAIRASTGALFSVPVAVCSLDDFGLWLQERSIRLVAASPDSQDTLWDTDMTAASALMVGAEDKGLSESARERSDRLVMIPMSGSSDSLNTSVSLALLTFEAVRQRAADG
jgi:RNA methyltransferase, TrmH family